MFFLGTFKLMQLSCGSAFFSEKLEHWVRKIRRYMSMDSKETQKKREKNSYMEGKRDTKIKTGKNKSKRMHSKLSPLTI